MVQLYAEILRSPVFRDNNFKPLASNDPSPTTLGWTITNLDGNGSATSDGDILTIIGGFTATTSATSTANNGLSTTGRYAIIRYKFTVYGAGGGNFSIGWTSPGNDSATLPNTSTFTPFVLALTSGKTMDDFVITAGVGSTLLVDYAYICGAKPIQLSQKDLISGTITRTALGADTARVQAPLASTRASRTCETTRTGGPAPTVQTASAPRPGP